MGAHFTSMWNIKNDRFIAFIDIMGFSNYVYRNAHASVDKRMRAFQDIINDHEVGMKSVSKEVQRKHKSLRTVCFSDSVLLISSDSSYDSLTNILMYSQLVITSCIEKRIPIKGAISYGQITADFDKSLFFGKALIDAYNLADELHMYGIILDDKIESKMDKLKFNPDPYCIQKKVPTKSGLITHFAIDWKKWMESTTKKKARKELSALYHQVSGQPRKYIDNTLDFIESK